MMADLVDYRMPQDNMQDSTQDSASRDDKTEPSFSFYLFDVDDDEMAALTTPCIVPGDAHDTFRIPEHVLSRCSSAFLLPQIDIEALGRVLSAE